MRRFLIPILQMEELRSKVVKYLDQDHVGPRKSVSGSIVKSLPSSGL